MYLLLKDENNSQSVLDQLNILAQEANAFQEEVQLGFGLHDVDDITFGRQVNGQLGPWYPILDSIFVLSLTLLILLPACFNYINLSIARSLKRGKEIGLRKIIGSSRRQIVFQFMVETFILSTIAWIGSIAIVFLIKNDFIEMLAPASRLTRIDLSLSSFLFGFIVAVFTAIAAGIAPAIYFSKLKPLESISASLKPGSFLGVNVRKGLTVFQFALSLGFLIGISAIIRQYQYSTNFDMGFERENVLVVPLSDVNQTLLKNEFSSFPEVQNVSFSSHIPGTLGASKTSIRESANMDSVLVREMYVDAEYLKHLGIKLIRGKGLTSDMPEQIEWIVVNEEFVDEFISEDSSHVMEKQWVLDDDKTALIVGVVKNFNVSTLKEKIQPVILRYNPDKFRYANVSVSSSDMVVSMDRLEDKWIELSETPFEAKFLDHHIESAFETYNIMMKVLGFQGMLVIVISCLGLLGMVVFTTENRVKEIGIRKILGASENKLVWLVSKGFMKLLLIATVVGAPIAFVIFDTMLSKTQYYSVGISYVEIVISVLIMYFLGGITIYWQTKKVTSINPVENLRDE